VAIKGKSSSSKYLFPNLNQGKHTYLMIKEGKRKVKMMRTSLPWIQTTLLKLISKV
jgi:hypothetical protein